MGTIYILAGPPRTGKTTIMRQLVESTHVQFVAGDAVEHGWRNLLTDSPHQMLRNIEIHGSAEFKTSITDGGERKDFTLRGGESELSLKVVLGMIDYYQRNEESVAFEGSAFTPEWASSLNAKGLNVRAAFVGYTDPAHVEQIIKHAKGNSHDWINGWLEDESGDETKIREWATRQSERCIELKQQATIHNYPFFDISTMSFEQYLNSVKHYFLES